MLNKIVFYFSSITLIFVLLSACGSENLSKNESSASMQTQQTLPRGKPGAPVSLKDVSPFVVAQTGIYEIEINLISSFSTGLMTVGVSSGEGIHVVSTLPLFEFSPNQEGEYRVPLRVDVRELGRHYIQLHISVNEKGQAATRAITVIVQAGESSAKLQKAISTSSSAARDVISHPAQETISPQ